jgi:hypothetical protein
MVEGTVQWWFAYASDLRTKAQKASHAGDDEVAVLLYDLVIDAYARCNAREEVVECLWEASYAFLRAYPV